MTTVRAIVAPSSAIDCQLSELASAYGRQVAYFLCQFASRKWRRYCTGNEYRKLRNQLVAGFNAGEKPVLVYGLQARQWKMALQQASSIVSNDWRLTQQRAKERIERSAWFGRLDDLERHYVRLLLCRLDDAFFEFLDGRTPTFTWHKRFRNEKVRNPRGLCEAVRRVIRAVRSKRIRHREHRSVWFDSSCYKTTTVLRNGRSVQSVELMTLEPRKRVKIELLGTKKITGTIKLVTTLGSWAIHTLEKPALKVLPESLKAQNGRLVCAAMDMGLTEVFTLQDGSQYGVELGRALRAKAEQINRLLVERNRMFAKAQNTPDRSKRRRIEKYNLGSQKFDRLLARHKAHVRDIVNQALNRIIKKYPAQVYIIEDLGHRFNLDGFSKAVNRLLSGWVRGFIRERLFFKAALFGRKIVKVPAAYGSQRCPFCGCVSRESRHGDKFQCVHCGAKRHADELACLNLLCRAHDERFGARMSKEEVLRLELEEHEKACAQRGTMPHKYQPRPSKSRAVRSAKQAAVGAAP